MGKYLYAGVLVVSGWLSWKKYLADLALRAENEELKRQLANLVIRS